MNIHTYIYTSMCTIIKTYMLGQCPICKPTRWAQPIMGRLCPIIILMVEVFTMLLGIALRHMLKSNVPAGFAIIFLGDSLGRLRSVAMHSGRLSWSEPKPCRLSFTAEKVHCITLPSLFEALRFQVPQELPG